MVRPAGRHPRRRRRATRRRCEDAFDHYAPEWRDQVRALVRGLHERRRAFRRGDADRHAARAGAPGCAPSATRCATMRARSCGVEGAVQEIAPHGHRPGTLLRHTVSMGGAMGSGEAFATVDREGRFTYVNEQAEQLLGRTAASCWAAQIWNFVPEDACGCAWRSSSGARFSAARTCWRSRSSTPACRAASRPGATPSAPGWRVHLRDVTARHKSQEQLRLLESSIARLNDIVIITEAGAVQRAGAAHRVRQRGLRAAHRLHAARRCWASTPRLLQGPGTQRARAGPHPRGDGAVAARARGPDQLQEERRAVLGRPGRLAGVGRGAPAHPLGGGRPRHHRAQDGRGEDPVPRLLRPADPAAQPPAAARPAAARADRPGPTRAKAR